MVENNSVSEEATASSRRPAANDVQVFVDREAGRGKNPLPARTCCGIETGGFGQLYPALDAAFAGGVTIVIDHALAPGAAEDRVRTARQDDRIFDRDDALIVIAVQRPGLQLSAAELAFVHQQMKRMLVMIALLAHGLELRAQLFELKAGARLATRRRLLQIELPSILRDFPARAPHLAIFGTRLVQHGIGVVDV